MMLHREQDIVDWARDKGILEKGDRFTQSLKTTEEVAELVRHILKEESIEDDLGDVYVTIVIQAALNDLTIEECISAGIPLRENNKQQVADMVTDCGYLVQETQDPIDLNNCIEDYIANIYQGLCFIASMSGLYLNNCIDIAYNEIAGRTGKMVDGVFVKDD